MARDPFIPDEPEDTFIPDRAPRSKTSRRIGQAVGGTTEGLGGTYGDILSLIPAYGKTPLAGRGQQAATEAEYDLPTWLAGLLSDEDIAPRYGRFPTGKEIGQALELSEPENFSERAVRRGSRAVGSGAATGIGSLLGLGSLGAGGIAGQGVEELTGSPIAGLLAELGLGIAGPAALSNRLAPSKSSQRAVDTAKRLGLQETEIAPAVTGKLQQRLSKFLGKKEEASKISEKSRKAIGGMLDQIKGEARDLPPLSAKSQSKLIIQLKDLKNHLAEGTFKSADTKHVISELENFIEKSHSHKFTPIELINDYEEINKIVNWNNVKNGKKSFVKVKKFLTAALEQESPELASDFQDANLLYSNVKKFQKILGKDYQNVLDKGEELGMIYALGTFKPLLASKLAGVHIGRKALTRYLLSPRGQGLMKKGLEAAKNNRAQHLIKINETIEKDLKKRSSKAQPNRDLPRKTHQE